MIKRSAILALLIYGLWSVACELPLYAMGSLPPHQPRYIRVAVIRDAPSLVLALRSPFQIKTIHTDELLLEGRLLKKARVSPVTNGIKIDRTIFKIYGLKIESKKEGRIYLNNLRFRGNIEIIKNPDQNLLVVNEIDVEDYLYGVLRTEVPYYWPLEVLKAQAVCARTFALYQNSINSKKDYDLTNDVYSQVYGGKSSEKFWTNRAVNKTFGEVLTYRGKIFPTYFHSTCGGHTENVTRVWGGDLPPLGGVKDPFCKRSSHYRWKNTIKLNKIQNSLAAAGYKVGKISAITTDQRNASGRVQEVTIKGTKGTIGITGNKFRHLVGINLVKSTNFTVEIIPPNVKFSGLGWGHGVGLCQWGAYFMARKGHNYKQILEYYYPGSKIENIYSDKDAD